MRPVVAILFAPLLIIATSACDRQDRVDAYFARGIALYEAGDLVKAKLEFRNVLQIDPKDARAWYRLGEIEEAQQNWRQAFTAFSKAAELDPDNLDARSRKARLMQMGGDADGALAEAEDVLAMDPENIDALVVRSAVRGERGETAAAAADAERVLARAPDNWRALALLARIRIDQGDAKAARDLLERAVTANPSHQPLRRLLVSVYDTLGESDKARATLEELVALDPRAVSNRVLLVNYLNGRGLMDAAEQVLQDAVAIAPDDPQPKLMLTAFLAEFREVAVAEAALKAFIDAQPNEFTLRFGLADLYRSANRSDAAEAVYREIIARDGTAANGLRARSALATLLLAQERLADAETLVDEVLTADARDSAALLARARIALQRDDPEQAIADLRTLMADEPDAVPALRLLALAHQQRDEIALAEESLKKAIETAPRQPAAYLELAELRAGVGDTSGALVILERLLAEVPDSVGAQTAIARIQLGQADVPGLAQTAERLLLTDPGNPLGIYLKGIALERLGQLAASIEQFERALAAAPTAIEPLLALARNYLAQGQPEKAESRLLEVLADDPENVLALNLLGDVYRATGRDTEAGERYAAAIRTRPTSPLAYERLALVQARGGDADAALATMREGIEATNNTVLLFRLATLLEEAEDFDAAARIYDRMLRQDLYPDAAANNLAMLLVTHRADDPQRLARAAELAERLEKSERPSFLDTAGWVQFKNGNYDRAVALLEQASDIGEPGPELRYHLGMAYLKQGRVDEAKQQLALAVAGPQRFPGLEEARAALEDL